MNKKGQLAIFVIIALVIVAVVLAVLFYPQIRGYVAPSEISPAQYLQDCIGPEVRNALDLLSKQGGYQNPEGYITYKDTKIKYLCYINGYYKPCIIQQPMIITHFGTELSNILTPKAESCVASLKTEFERRGYQVKVDKIMAVTSMQEGRILIEFITPMSVIKATTRTFDKFSVSVPSEMYNLLSISTSIVDYEATYGDSETTAYLQYYPDLKIEKIRLEEGVKIYRLSNVVTNESFQFATRSLVWPAGYGLT